MRKLLLITLPLLLIVGCSSSPEPINYETTLIEREGVFYTIDKNKPYSGKVFSLYDDGNKESEWTLKDGRLDGLYTLWYKSGRKWLENIYKDGKLDGLSTYWDRKEQLDTKRTYKNGELISQKCWDEDRNECDCSDLGRGCK